jgi:hypothetical protein
MKTTHMMMAKSRAAVLGAFVLAAMAMMLIPAHAEKGGSSGIRLRAKLTGPAIATVTPSGQAQFKTNSLGNRSELEVEVEHVNLPSGTVLDVQLKTTSIGSIKVNKEGEGELELETDAGATVPAVAAGDTISVLNAGTVILTGVF